MFAAAIPIAMAAASYFGQSDTNESNRKIAREANEQNYRIFREGQAFSAQQAKQAMDFNERMSNTAWQRGIFDMKAAGVNPMLAFSRGGASSPNAAIGSSSAVGATTGAPMQNALGAGAVSALSAVRAIAEIRNVEAQNAQILSQTRLNNANARNVENIEPKSRLHGGAYEKVNKVVDKVSNSSSGWFDWFDRKMKEAHRNNSAYQVFK